jgi:hypothetical protein
MSWFRVGDTAATDPRILALEDPRHRPAAWARCASGSW